MVKKNKSLIFGTGSFYESHKKTISQNFKILGFFDNDTSKHGQTIDNIPIMSPDEIANFSFDVIFIMSGEFYFEIKEQLLNLGISPGKIVVGDHVALQSNKNINNFVEMQRSSFDYVLLACMPKSGSTYMRRIFGSFPEFSEVNFVPGYGQREQELCEYTMYKTVEGAKSCIAQQHVRYSSETGKIINKFDLKVIVLVRNIFDVIISIYDHWSNESTVGPLGTIPENWIYWQKETAYEFIIDMIIPWYFNFYVSWLTCPIKHNIVFINYDNFMDNKPKVINDICLGLKINTGDTNIEKISVETENKNTRKNIGEAGRGAVLPEGVKEKVRRMSAYYDGIDFSSIGL